MTDAYANGGAVALIERGSVCDILVEHSADGRPVSILKRLPPESASCSTYRHLLEREASLLARLARPGLPELLSADVTVSSPWLRYRWLPGETVAAAWRGAGAEAARAIALGLIEHLRYLHNEHGIVHGDVAARNIIVDRRRDAARVALIDFGNAWQRARPWRRLPQPAYRAPEQAPGNDWSDPADLFQAGTVIHEVFTGLRPGALNTLKTEGGLPRAWRRWFQELLDPDPGRRPDAMTALCRLPGRFRTRSSLARAFDTKSRRAAWRGEVAI
ncbi:MAG: protein kinase [Halofilum sp. (in: g-proteobacteria)]|nr:protein kinase [Halofilum sp. (in: g-proteobacteria)]